MRLKKIASLIMAGAIICSFSGVAFAELLSASFGIPVYQSFQDGEIESDGMPVGFLIHVKFPIMVGVGIERYQSEVDAGEDMTVITNMFDVFYLLPIPVVNITLGLGVGNITLESAQNFESEAFAYQGWVQVGVPITPLFDIHVSYHKISAKVESKISGEDDADFNSDMIAVGASLVF